MCQKLVGGYAGPGTPGCNSPAQKKFDMSLNNAKGCILLKYRMRVIISRGLYILYPIFETISVLMHG